MDGDRVSFAVPTERRPDFAAAAGECLEEWQALYNNRIVPQKPRRSKP